MNHIPEIKELRILLRLAEEGGFANAAKSLGISQPAVSNQISKIEQQLGFPLLSRSQKGSELNEHGRELLPLLRDVETEYLSLLAKVSYWMRAQEKQVNILTDGSRIAQELRVMAHAAGRTGETEVWKDVSGVEDWVRGLRSYDVDIVIAGSFLRTADCPEIRTEILSKQNGISIAWNPAYYDFVEEPFSFPDAISSTVILPAPAMALGFGEFIRNWCATSYGIFLNEQIVAKTEAEAADACRSGVGVLVFPGDVEPRMNLLRHGVKIARTFEFLLPDAFTFGWRYRAKERNPAVLDTLDKLKADFAKIAGKT